MTSKEINAIIVDRYGRRDMVIGNYYFNHFEADCLRVTDNNQLIEYEIKLSVSDFKADLKKERYGKVKHTEIKEGRHVNRFFFVCPKDLIKVTDVPKYAGLVYVTNNTWKIVKNAPLLHKNNASESFYKTLAIKLYWRLKGVK